MTLVISSLVTLANSCDEVTLLDATGNYDITINPTGWGTPNPDTSDITAATLTISNSAFISDIIVDIFADIADYLSGGLTKTILELLGTDVAADGYYTFTVTLTVSGTDYTYSSAQAFFCLGKCCLLKKLATIPLPLTQDEKAFDELTEMFVLFNGMYWASCCGKSDRFTYLLNEFNNLCSPCGTVTTATGTTSNGCCS